MVLIHNCKIWWAFLLETYSFRNYCTVIPYFSIKRAKFQFLSESSFFRFYVLIWNISSMLHIFYRWEEFWNFSSKLRLLLLKCKRRAYLRLHINKTMLFSTDSEYLSIAMAFKMVRKVCQFRKVCIVWHLNLLNGRCYSSSLLDDNELYF